MTQILVEGVIAPWLWNSGGSYWYQGALTDPGLFTSAGTSLTGMPIEILWSDLPYITAAITINGTTVTLGSPPNDYCVYACYSYTVFRNDYQNITVANFNPYNDLPWNISVNSYDPDYTANPHGIGGALGLIGPSAPCDDYHGGNVGPSCQQTLAGYFYVQSMVSVPGPIVGAMSPLFTVALLACVMLRKFACVRRWFGLRSRT